MFKIDIKLKYKGFVISGTVILIALFSVACKEKKPYPSKQMIAEIGLKKGAVISCGPSDNPFGFVDFRTSCSAKTRKNFSLALEMLHSFEYDEAEKVFGSIIRESPDCAMAYWGVAMCNYHPLWAPPSEAELRKGSAAIRIARSIQGTSPREAEYVAAISAFYTDWEKTDHNARTIAFEKAMEKLHVAYPSDREAAIFYALSLDAASDPADKTYTKQKKAAQILNALYPNEPDHPGIAHYLIHTYDYPGLAILALPMARKYALIAPASAHALHMPSHIFTRLGLWDECIASNLASTASARCYAESAGITGTWDEELHGMDYLVYAYLQKGENDLAKQQWDHLKSIKTVYPVNFKVAYAFAAIPSRYVLENRQWKDAAGLETYPSNFPWNNFGWQKAIIHFARLLGSVHTGDSASAQLELLELNRIHDTLVAQKDAYKANQVQIQITASLAWMLFSKGKKEEGVMRMKDAADLEEKTGKHPVTPGEVLPARELLGDMLLQMNQPVQALDAYKSDLSQHPNRFNGLYGAGMAAENSHNLPIAANYYRQLLSITSSGKSSRPELSHAKLFLQKYRDVR